MIKMTKALFLALIAGVTTATFIDPSHALRAEEVIRTALVALTAGGTTATFIDPGGSSRAGRPMSPPPDPFEPPVYVPSNSPLPAPHEPFDATPITAVETVGAPADMDE